MYFKTHKETKVSHCFIVTASHIHALWERKNKDKSCIFRKVKHRKPKRDSIGFERFTLNPFACNAYESLTSYTMPYSPRAICELSLYNLNQYHSCY